MSYCYMISPILSYKVCSSVSSLFPVCNCGLILYRKKEVMTRIINELIRVFSGLLKTFGLETASEFGNTTALFALLKTWGKSAQLANAQTIHFFPITQLSRLKCYQKFLQRFPNRKSLYPESLFFSHLLCRGRRSLPQPLLHHTSSDKVRGWMGSEKGLKSRRIFVKILWFCLA